MYEYSIRAAFPTALLAVRKKTKKKKQTRLLQGPGAAAWTLRPQIFLILETFGMAGLKHSINGRNMCQCNKHIELIL